MNALLELHRRMARNGPRTPAERLLFAVLLPLSALYGLVGVVRVKFYRLGVFRRYRAPVPVISIGNLAAGGTGKTPTVDFVLKFFQRQGIRAACVSRGYGGRKIAGVGTVCRGHGPELSPDLCGDEPYLLARRNPGSVVLVAPRRSDGVRKAVENFGARIVVLDDGFQHLAVKRDLDIVLLDGRNPLGNGCPLPAGDLREFPAALSRGHLFLLTRWHSSSPAPPEVPGPLLRSRHVLAGDAFSLQGERVDLERLRGRRGVAFAGIADPHGFFRQLEDAGLQLSRRLALPDHEPYGPELRGRLSAACGDADYLVTTEKDGVKLDGQAFPIPCYQVPMVLEILEEDVFCQALMALLKTGVDDAPET